MEKPKTVRVGNITVTQISPKEREILAQKIKERHAQLRNRYREIHKKVVDWVSHSVEEGNVYVCIRFMDKTEFSLQFSPQNPNGRHRFIGYEHRELQDDSRVLPETG